MNEQEIREKYQRSDESDPRGSNVDAINRFIEMLKQHEKSTDSRIRSITLNISSLSKLAPNFTIFQGKGCFFMHKFKAYQIASDSNMLTVSHEFGHAVLSIANDTKVPSGYDTLISRAKQYALLPENKEYLKNYIEYLCGKTEEKDLRTEAEKGPLSDIISSIFQREGLRIGSFDNICIFPSCHRRSYYFDEENNLPNIKNIFDEDFANYYALKANNCTKELETLKLLFGGEFVQALDMQLDLARERFLPSKDISHSQPVLNPMEQIKHVISFSREGELSTLSLQLENNIEKGDEGRNE